MSLEPAVDSWKKYMASSTHPPEEGGIWCLWQPQQDCSRSTAAGGGGTKAVRELLCMMFLWSCRDSGCPECEPGEEKIALLASSHRLGICVLRGAFVKSPSD